eukprot:Pgem_evm1s13548
MKVKVKIKRKSVISDDEEVSHDENKSIKRKSISNFNKQNHTVDSDYNDNNNDDDDDDNDDEDNDDDDDDDDDFEDCSENLAMSKMCSRNFSKKKVK